MSQVLQQEQGVQLVVLGAGLQALHPLLQLHGDGRRSPQRRGLSGVHQWREIVSVRADPASKVKRFCPLKTDCKRGTTFQLGFWDQAK